MSINNLSNFSQLKRYVRVYVYVLYVLYVRVYVYVLYVLYVRVYVYVLYLVTRLR